MTASVAPNPLRLPPDPAAARDARAWVAEALPDWPKESVDTARLLVSELVTNSVLHAGTAIDVSYRLDGPRVRFEVTDRHRRGPVAKRYSPDSPTGRGMRLVASLADEWGVHRDDAGKTVWFVVSPSTRGAPQLDPSSVAEGLAKGLRAIAAPAPRQGEPQDPAGPRGQGQGQRGPERIDERVDVVALALPVDVYLEAEQHNDALMRELTLILQSESASGGLDVPRRLVQLANEVRAAFLPATTALRAQVEVAVQKGRDTVDIHMSVPRKGWEALLRLADWLDEVDRYCEEGDLLTLASSARLRRFRAWYVQQIVDQVHGRPPTPWGATRGT